MSIVILGYTILIPIIVRRARVKRLRLWPPFQIFGFDERFAAGKPSNLASV